MLISKLGKILKDRRLSISEVSQATGISRTTLTSLSQNAGNGIQFETLEKLCAYLSIPISELFAYYPFNVILEFLLPSFFNIYNEEDGGYIEYRDSDIFDINLHFDSVLPDGPSIKVTAHGNILYDERRHELTVRIMLSDNKYEMYRYQMILDQADPVIFEHINNSLKTEIENEILNELPQGDIDNISLHIDTSDFLFWDRKQMYDYALLSIVAQLDYLEQSNQKSIPHK